MSEHFLDNGRDPRAMLAFIRAQARASDMPTINLKHDRISTLASEIDTLAAVADMTTQDYMQTLATQRVEAHLLSLGFQAATSPSEFVRHREALDMWLDDTLTVPRTCMRSGTIDSRELVESIYMSGAHVLETAEDPADMLDGFMSLFNKEGLQSRQRLAVAMHGLAGDYTSAESMRKIKIKAEPRTVMSLVSHATDAGVIAPDFWYRYGVRTHGSLQFHVVEGVYEQVVLRGRDIRRKSHESGQFWEHLPNFCVEVFGSLKDEEVRHIRNASLIHDLLAGGRSAASKALPPTEVIKVANSITSKVNRQGGFGADYDDTGRQGELPHLQAADIHNLPEAMRRLLYITRRADKGEEVAEWQRYQDFVYSGAIEGFIGLLSVPQKTRRALGGTAVQDSRVQLDANAVARHVPNTSVLAWKRNKPGYGLLS